VLPRGRRALRLLLALEVKSLRSRETMLNMVAATRSGARRGSGRTVHASVMEAVGPLRDGVLAGQRILPWSRVRGTRAECSTGRCSTELPNQRRRLPLGAKRVCCLGGDLGPSLTGARARGPGRRGLPAGRATGLSKDAGDLVVGERRFGAAQGAGDVGAVEDRHPVGRLLDGDVGDERAGEEHQGGLDGNGEAAGLGQWPAGAFSLVTGVARVGLAVPVDQDSGAAQPRCSWPGAAWC
jgi:hypothetical protein